MSKLNFKPKRDFIIIKLPEIEEVTESGIIKSEEMIREESSKDEQVVEVLAIGPEVKDTVIGERIIIMNHRVPVINIEGVRCAAIRGHDVIGEVI